MIIIGLIILFAVGVKIYTNLSFPRISDWNYHQLQQIDQTKDELSFVVFGDNRNSNRTFNDMVKKVNKDNIMFAIDGGDLVFNSGMENYIFFVNQVKRFHKPLMTVVGNHDIEGERNNYYTLFGRFYYSFHSGSSYFIVLDSSDSTVDAWQIGWFEQELQKAQQYKYRFVFMHVPLYDPQEGAYAMGQSLKDLGVAKRLNDLCDSYHVTMLFTSHIHGYFSGKWHATPYIITGGAGAPLDGVNAKHYFYHYIKVNVKNNGVFYDVVKLPSPDFELLDRTAAYVWIYICSFYNIHFWDSIVSLAVVYFIFYAIFYKKCIIFNFKNK